jgi:uncharacterized repeat protein (TIGR02543 family)
MFLRWSLIIGLFFVSTVCKSFTIIVGGGGGGEPPPPLSISIYSPTSTPTYSTTSPELNIAGVANSTQFQVEFHFKWANDTGGGGMASGFSYFYFNGIKLRSGQNDITVSVSDENGNNSQASLTVYYTSPPKITAPLPNQRWSNAVFNVTGIITNSVNVSNVMYQLNGSGWNTATTTNNWSNWVAQVSLTPGTNTIQAYALDNVGNFTPTNQVKFVYVPIAMLSLETNGIGTISPNYRGVSLLVGNSYKITATAAKGFSFAGWTGSSATNSRTLKFVMASNLTFTANFQDTTKPKLTIKTPTAGQHMSSALASITGTATDNWKVASVWYQLNGGAWNQATTANGWTNWLATVELQNATNVIKAYAVDFGGNVSPTVSVSFVSSNAFKLRLALAMEQPLVTNGLNVNLQTSPGLNGHIQVSTNLVDWVTLTNFVGTNANINFLDPAATNFDQRFYRAVIP